MSVRDGLLAILSLGSAYGLQLHSELSTRAPHRPPLNVGQVYSTLDRAASAGLIESAGHTTDGLPLSRLTAAGHEHADAWMSQPTPGTPSWGEMLDQFLITSTIAPPNIRGLASGYSQAWARTVKDGDDPATAAARALASAATAWMAEVEPALSAARPIGLSSARPRRGRRPTRVA